MTQTSHQVTKLLKDWSDGEQSVPDQLIPLVYEELRRLAHQYMRRENPATRCRPPRWSMRRMFGWWTKTRFNGKVEHTQI
jgi:ECF sigma factor